MRRAKDAYYSVDIYGSRYFEIESVYIADVYICMHINAEPREMFSNPREGPSPAFNLRLAICSPVSPPCSTNARCIHSGCMYALPKHHSAQWTDLYLALRFQRCSECFSIRSYKMEIR